MPVGFGSFGTKRRENCFPWPRMEHIYCITIFDKLNKVFIIANNLRAILVILAFSKRRIKLLLWSNKTVTMMMTTTRPFSRIFV